MKAKFFYNSCVYFSEYMFCIDYYYLLMKSRVYFLDVVCIFLFILSFFRENIECMYFFIVLRLNRDSLLRFFLFSFSFEIINVLIYRFI